MKNTLIPLDIIWLDEAKKVVRVKPDAQPCLSEYCPLFQPDSPALYVLEIIAGQAAAKGIETGDQAEFRQP